MCGRSDKAQVWPLLVGGCAIIEAVDELSYPLLVIGCAIIEAVDELSYPKLAVRGRISGRAQR